MSESVLNFLEEKNLPEVTKKKHTYLMMDGHDQEDIYILKDGVVKVSIVLCDGREFNITYLKGLDMISLLKDEINKITTYLWGDIKRIGHRKVFLGVCLGDLFVVIIKIVVVYSCHVWEILFMTRCNLK